MTSETKSAATSSAIKHLNEDRNPRGKDDKRNASSGGNHPITSQTCFSSCHERLIQKITPTFTFVWHPSKNCHTTRERGRCWAVAEAGAARAIMGELPPAATRCPLRALCIQPRPNRPRNWREAGAADAETDLLTERGVESASQLHSPSHHSRLTAIGTWASVAEKQLSLRRDNPRAEHTS
jgi:hypothetical protein